MKFEPKTYQDIIKLANGITEAGAIKKNAKFSLRIARNKYALTKYIDFLTAASEASAEYMKLDKEKREIFSKYATESVEGQPKIPDENWTAFKEELEKFKAENKDVDDARDAQLIQYGEIVKSQPLNDDNEPLVIDLSEVTESMIPDDLNGNQIEAIMPIIKFK